MNNYLAHLAPNTSPAKVRSELAEMTKDDVISTTLDLYQQSAMARAVGPGKIAGGAFAGFTIGELINLALRRWGGSTLPGAELVKEWFNVLRLLPPGLIGAITAVKYSDLKTPGRAVAFASSLGMLVPVGARIVDLLLHQGDLNAQEEQKLQADLAALRAENERLRQQQAQR